MEVVPLLIQIGPGAPWRYRRLVHRLVCGADLNGDGFVDLVAASFGSNSVSVLLGNGNGTFRRNQDYTTDYSPQGVALGDLNGDSILDIVTVNFFTPTVSVLLGNGDGTFQAQTVYPTIYSSVKVAMADLNGDGKLDVVTDVWLTPGAVSVLLGNGDGTLQPHVEYSTGPQPVWVSVADFNEDGKPDLVTANGFYGVKSLSVLLGNGDGTFQPHVDHYGTGVNPCAATVADFNADDHLDLGIADCGPPGGVDVVVGRGDGTFGGHVQYAFGDGSGSLATGDLNGDGAVDLVVSNFYSNTESVLLNSGGTHMQVTSSPNPSTLGQSVTFTATVLPTFSSVGNPSGVVAFMDGVVELGTVPLASGQASFTTTSLTEGDHNIRVLYSGDKLFNRNKRHLSQTVMP